jgi:serine protease Do
MWPLELPGEWIVVEQDVYQDFGRLDLTGLTFTCQGGGHLVVDHVYVARTPKDFERLPPAPSPKETNEKARLVLARPAIAKGAPAIVSLDADGQPGTGVLIGDKGWVVTAGHLIVGVGAKIKVRTRDGRTLAARVAGIDRESDLGLIKIIGKGAPRGLEVSDVQGFRPNCMYVGFSFAPSHQGGKTPRSYVTLLQAAGTRTARMDVSLPDAAMGGPLLDSQGRLVGVHNDTIPPGMLQFTKAHSLTQNWDRLTRGEIWGQWMRETGPMMGIHTTQRGAECHINFVYDQTPAARAGLQAKDILLKVEGQPVQNHYEVGRVLGEKSPGDQVTVEIRRGEQTLQHKLSLIRRRRFDRESEHRRAH